MHGHMVKFACGVHHLEILITARAGRWRLAFTLQVLLYACTEGWNVTARVA